jgi:epoxyqueuosine reductase
MENARMQDTKLNKLLKSEAESQGCNCIGIAEINEGIKKEFTKDFSIDGTPAKFVVILAMVLEDPIQDAWTQSPLWPVGKNYIDEALAHIATQLALMLTKWGYPSRPLGYGGSYLKHLAVHAGMGIIGRNNLLITPQYGPHVRLRGLLTQAPLAQSECLIGKFNPCVKCSNPPSCIKACPSNAFTNPQDEILQSDRDDIRAPRTGYQKEICRTYSLQNLREVGPFTYIWCRACEEACPIGVENLSKK